MTTTPLTRDFKETVNARVQRDSALAAALLDEAISLFLNGEPETARLILIDVVQATPTSHLYFLNWRNFRIDDFFALPCKSNG